MSALSSHRLFGEETKDKLPSAEFLSAVGTLKFRGTSILFRLAQSCITHLKRSVLSLHSRDSVTLGSLCACLAWCVCVCVCELAPSTCEGQCVTNLAPRLRFVPFSSCCKVGGWTGYEDSGVGLLSGIILYREFKLLCQGKSTATV